MEQRTEEWRIDRLGYFNASEVGSLMKSGRSKSEEWSETAKSYMQKVLAERLLMPSWRSVYFEQTELRNAAVNWGVDYEQEAKDYYAEQMGQFVSESGGICMQDYWLRASPDGIIYYEDEDGTKRTRLVEIKCPYTIDNSLKQMQLSTPEELLAYNDKYYWQVVAQMATTEAEWCDWVTYDPRLQKRMSVLRIRRNEEEIDRLLDRCAAAKALIKERLNNLLKD